MFKVPAPYLLAGAAALAAIAFVAVKGFKGTGQAVGSAAVDLVDGTIGGVILRSGEIVGVPATDQSECARARAEGRTWDASFACPAKDFIKHVFS